MTDSYEDIINLPRPVRLNRPRMPQASRAAQFAPFAALVGYEESVRETAGDRTQDRTGRVSQS